MKFLGVFVLFGIVMSGHSSAATCLTETAVMRWLVEETLIDRRIPPRLLHPSPRTHGNSNRGIFEVRLTDGRRVALKLTPVGSFGDGEDDIADESFQTYVEIHTELAKAGLALKLEGLLLEDEVNKLVPFLAQAYPVNRRKPMFGILLEYLPQPWNLSKEAAPVPWLRQWTRGDLVRLIERITRMQHKLNARSIYAIDRQLFVWQSGQRPEIVLGDIEPYIRSCRLTNSFSFDIDCLIKAWETATGQHFAYVPLGEPSDLSHQP